MPTYAFDCKCGRQVDAFRAMSARNAPGPRCPCGRRMRRNPGRELVAIQTADNFRYSDVHVPGIPAPRGGWGSRGQLTAALKKQGREGELDDKDTWTNSEKQKLLHPLGTRVDPKRKVAIT